MLEDELDFLNFGIFSHLFQLSHFLVNIKTHQTIPIGPGCPAGPVNPEGP